MLIEEFLEEDDRYLQLIVSWLELKKDSYVYIGEIDELLGLSRFKVKKYLDILANDLAAVSSIARIEVAENGQLVTSNFTNLLVKKVRLYLLKRSIKFRYYMDVLLGDMTFESFCSVNYISRSTMYEIRKTINHTLQKKNIKIQNNQLKGSEEDIRNFTFSFIYSAFNGLESPFQKIVVKELGELMSRLVLIYDLSLSTSEKDQLAIFLGILYLRRNQKVYFSEKLVEIANDSELSLNRNAFPTFIKRWTDQRIQQEYTYLNVFLFCKTELAISKTTQKAIQSLIGFEQLQEFAKHFTKRIVEDRAQVDEELETIFCQEITKIMVKLLYLEIDFDSFYSTQQLLFFKESYPSINYMVEREIAYLKRKLTFPSEKTQRLYYELIFLVINKMPLEILEKEIYICVDFAQGRNYTGVISKQILGFKNLSLRIESTISTKTQLYVSDAPIVSHSIEQIIWKNPPTPIDWREFGDKLIEIKKGKKSEE
ncbi:hypothetical protein BAU15_08800 [Enterococcus sp. JM4C]|uniref:helix-turn-helix domain-containing protein n=1 Tax=Candidatus Enterococcus huntleyi TaxID=1857217 RepID=UPI00137B0466|nr:helix-turn-helix domain-containing protein [Enterococcus sp. JM4C]KAF1296735.1 hypothetical protein BAU15_08800 [Enterococcus sp. JM4C]